MVDPTLILVAQAQQIMHQRVGEAASERSARERLQEDADSAARTIQKLEERQEAVAAAGTNNVSATEWQMKQERDKLLVRRGDGNRGSSANSFVETAAMFLLRAELQAAGHRQMYAQYVDGLFYKVIARSNTPQPFVDNV